MRLEQLHPTWRQHQSRTLIVHPPKAVADLSGYSLDWIYDLKNATTPVCAETAFHLGKAQKDFRFLQDLAQRAGTLLHLPSLVTINRPTILLLADLSFAFGRFFTLAEKLQRNEPLSDSEQREIEEQAEKIKEAVDRTIARARENRERAREEGRLPREPGEKKGRAA